MRYSALDPAFRLPAVRPDSSRAYRYTPLAHLTAVSPEASKPVPTTTAAPRCARTDYLHGFAFRLELRRRGLLPVPETLRPRRRALAPLGA
jgi:hypothetical protein